MTDNSALYSLVSLISSRAKLWKEASNYEASHPDTEIPADLKERLDSLGSESSPEEFRACARAVFAHQIKSMGMKAADWGAFDKVLNLDEDIAPNIYLVDFAAGLSLGHDLAGLTADRVAVLREQLRSAGWDGLIGSDVARPLFSGGLPAVADTGEDLAEAGGSDNPPETASNATNEPNQGHSDGENAGQEATDPGKSTVPPVGSEDLASPAGDPVSPAGQTLGDAPGDS